MFIIYEFFVSYTDPLSHEEQHNVWIAVASFSQLTDAEWQVADFISRGIPEEDLQILPDNEPAP